MPRRSRRTGLVAALSAGALILVAAPPAMSAVLAESGETRIRPTAVSASTSDDNEPANVLDGDEDTRWSGKGDGAWLHLDLGGVKKVTKIKLAVYHGDERQNDFELQVGDGTRWTTVYDGLSGGESTELQTFDVTDAEGSKVRYLGHGHLDDEGERGAWNSLTEVQVLGSNGSGGGGGGGGGGQTGKPSEVLNLTNWKIQLPSGSEGKVDEVKQPELKNYSHDTFFVADGKGGVRFRAAVNGATTANSAYPRSELREMNGSSNAAWSAGSGTHTMVVEEAFTKVPNDKPHVVGAQIHGGSDDVSVFRLEGTKVYVTNGDNAHHKLVTGNYRLGTRFQAKFVVSGGQVRAYYNGALQTTFDADFSAGYFKAGAYTQANCENSSPCSADNYGETRIYSLDVKHG